MKTDYIEIFQTIRAELQPYAALGFTNRTNSESEYDLWSEKNIKEDNVTERFFASIKIEEDHVCFRYSTITGDDQLQERITKLDDVSKMKIDDILSATYKTFKETEWV
jgi:hypothetical protein